MIAPGIETFGLLVTGACAGAYTEAWVRGRRRRDGLLALWLWMWGLVIWWGCSQ